MRRTVRSTRRAVHPPQDRTVRRVERRGLPHGRGVARLAAAAGARERVRGRQRGVRESALLHADGRRARSGG